MKINDPESNELVDISFYIFVFHIILTSMNEKLLKLLKLNKILTFHYSRVPRSYPRIFFAHVCRPLPRVTSKYFSFVSFSQVIFPLPARILHFFSNYFYKNVFKINYKFFCYWNILIFHIFDLAAENVFQITALICVLFEFTILFHGRLRNYFSNR